MLSVQQKSIYNCERWKRAWSSEFNIVILITHIKVSHRDTCAQTPALVPIGLPAHQIQPASSILLTGRDVLYKDNAGKVKDTLGGLVTIWWMGDWPCQPWEASYEWTNLPWVAFWESTSLLPSKSKRFLTTFLSGSDPPYHKASSTSLHQRKEGRVE